MRGYVLTAALIVCGLFAAVAGWIALHDGDLEWLGAAALFAFFALAPLLL